MAETAIMGIVHNGHFLKRLILKYGNYNFQWFNTYLYEALFIGSDNVRNLEKHLKFSTWTTVVPEIILRCSA